MLHLTVNGEHQFEFPDHKAAGPKADSGSGDSVFQMENGAFSIIRGGKSYTGMVDAVDRESKTVQLRINNVPYTVAIEEPLDRLLRDMGLDATAGARAEAVKAPMPGLVLQILVTPGQTIEKGDGLLVLEAMKMENVLKATAPGTVKSIRVAEKTAVEKGTVLIEME